MFQEEIGRNRTPNMKSTILKNPQFYEGTKHMNIFRLSDIFLLVLRPKYFNIKLGWVMHSSSLSSSLEIRCFNMIFTFSKNPLFYKEQSHECFSFYRSFLVIFTIQVVLAVKFGWITLSSSSSSSRLKSSVSNIF